MKEFGTVNNWKLKLLGENKILICPKVDDSFIMQLNNYMYKKRKEGYEIWTSTVLDREQKYVRIISESEIEEIVDIYHMYEFTNNIFLLFDIDINPSLYNYLNTGLLSDDEFIEAMTNW